MAVKRDGEGSRALIDACRYRHISTTAVQNAHVDPAFRAVMEDRLLELGSHFGIEDFFSGWFRDAPFESIRCLYCQRPEVLRCMSGVNNGLTVSSAFVASTSHLRDCALPGLIASPPLFLKAPRA